jgi:hypothetical protein
LEGDALQPILATFWEQLHALLTREGQALVRDKAALAGRFGITIFLNLLFGVIFEGAGSRDSAEADALPAHFGALVMVTIGSMFGTAQPVMLGFPLERPVFLREYTTVRQRERERERPLRSLDPPQHELPSVSFYF